jgi:hypothetical protein
MYLLQIWKIADNTLKQNSGSVPTLHTVVGSSAKILHLKPEKFEVQEPSVWWGRTQRRKK